MLLAASLGEGPPPHAPFLTTIVMSCSLTTPNHHHHHYTESVVKGADTNLVIMPTPAATAGPSSSEHTPWLGAYQNVPLDGSDAYLTQHQRQTLQHFREEQGSGLGFQLRQQLERLREGTANMVRRVQGEEGMESIEPFGSLFRSRRMRYILTGSVLLMALLFILSLFGHGSRSSGSGGGGGGRRVVPKNLQPLPASQDHLCINLAREKAPPGKKFIQIHNRCSGEVIYPAMIGQGGGSVAPAWLEDGTATQTTPTAGGSWRFEPGDCRTMLIPAIFPSMRMWGRTGCNGTTVQDFKCQTGDCVINGDLSCTSAGTVSSLFEGTFQGWCPQPGTPPTPGIGSDFYDLSLVDGYNLPMGVELIGGHDVPQVPAAMNCVNPTINPILPEDCPFELRSYTDKMPGTSVPLTSIQGVALETSPCYVKPLDPTCAKKFSGCMSLCKAFDEGWIGYYIDHVQGNKDKVDPILTRPNGQKIRWSKQYLGENATTCGPASCRENPAFGGYRGTAYGANGNMKSLVCCDGNYRCSPYQPNNSPGCSYASACPTLGSADPESRFHGKRGVHDETYPQTDQEVRMSSSFPDWPLPTTGGNYAQIYKKSNPTAYSWQYNDGSSSLFVCCGDPGKVGKGGGPLGTPHYKITFCP